MIVVRNEKRVSTYYSINFIDENDLFLGFDDNQCCCEYADYFVSLSEHTKYDNEANQISDFDFAGWNFVDPRILPETKVEVEDECDEGLHIAFMMVHPEKGTAWLHFFNCHNGYYGHSVLMGEHKDGEVVGEVCHESV